MGHSTPLQSAPTIGQLMSVIANVPIEDHVKAFTPIASNVVLIGDKQKYLTMLVTLKQKQVIGKGLEDALDTDAKKFGKEHGVTKVSEAVNHAAFKAAVEEGIKKYNTTKAVSNAQKVQKFHICKEDFTEDGGELTATQKLKRKEVTKKYKAEIMGMYGADFKED